MFQINFSQSASRFFILPALIATILVHFFSD
jgi:hypothetical protein